MGFTLKYNAISSREQMLENIFISDEHKGFGDYFDDKKFLTKEYAKHLLANVPIIRYNETPYIYQNEKGYWEQTTQRNAINRIRSMATNELDTHEISLPNRQLQELSNAVLDIADQSINPFATTNINKVSFANVTYDFETNSFEKHDPQNFLIAGIPIEIPEELLEFVAADYSIPTNFEPLNTQELIPASFTYYDVLDYPKVATEWLKALFETPEHDLRFKQAFGEDTGYLKRYVIGYGYYQSYEPQQNITFIYGKPGNGKSTFINRIIKPLFGNDNISDVEYDKLIGEGKSSGRFDIANIIGKSLNISPDIPDTFYKNADRLKSLTSGDGIQVEKKGVQGFEAVNTAKLVLVTNHIPRNKADDGLADRVYIIEDRMPCMRHETERKEYAYDETKLEQERPYFALKCLIDFWLHMDEPIRKTENMLRLEKQWLEESDPIKSFMAEHTEQTSETNTGISTGYLYNMYIDFTGSEIKEKFFNEHLTGLGYVKMSRMRSVDEKDDDPKNQKTRWRGLHYYD